MQKNTPIERVLRIAIRKEKEARSFYLELSGRVDDPSTKQALEFLAEEEAGHQEFLEKYLRGDIPEGALKLSEAVDYKIVEHQEEEPDESGPLNPEKAFLLAVNREKAAHEFNMSLSKLHSKGAVKDLLMKMASEELRHKEKMEHLYANTAFPQTSGG